MLPPAVPTHFFRWIPVASYDNSQSDIDVMFEYKYVSISRGISSWPTNSFATIREKCSFKNQSYFTYSAPILSLPLFCVCVRHSEHHSKGTRWAPPGLRRCPVGLTYLLLWRKQCRCFMITDSNLVYIICTSCWHSYNHHNRNSKMCAGWLLVDLQFWAWRLFKV